MPLPSTAPTAPTHLKLDDKHDLHGPVEALGTALLAAGDGADVGVPIARAALLEREEGGCE